MRVVVTGGTGRAGQWVVRNLAEAGHEVVNFDVADRPELELPGEFCRVDLTDAGKVYDALFQFRPEGICHLAANPAPSGQAQIDVFDNNVVSAPQHHAGGRGSRRLPGRLRLERDGHRPADRRHGSQRGSRSTRASGTRRRTRTPSASTSAR